LLFGYDLQNLYKIYQVLQYIQIDHCIMDAAYLNFIIATKYNNNIIVGSLLNNTIKHKYLITIKYF